MKTKGDITGYFSKVMGARGITKGVLMTHLYLFILALMINSMMYLGITKPSFENFYTSSVLNIQEEIESEHLESQELLELKAQVQDFDGEISALKEELTHYSSKATNKEVIVKEVVRVIHQEPVSKNTSGIQPVLVPQQVNESGAMIVDASECESGYASVTPRLVRTCIK
jgi:hypothetical protein